MVRGKRAYGIGGDGSLDSVDCAFRMQRRRTAPWGTLRKMPWNKYIFSLPQRLRNVQVSVLSQFCILSHNPRCLFYRLPDSWIIQCSYCAFAIRFRHFGVAGPLGAFLNKYYYVIIFEPCSLRCATTTPLRHRLEQPTWPPSSLPSSG